MVIIIDGVFVHADCIYVYILLYCRNIEEISNVHFCIVYFGILRIICK